MMKEILAVKDLSIFVTFLQPLDIDCEKKVQHSKAPDVRCLYKNKNMEYIEKIDIWRWIHNQRDEAQSERKRNA